MVLSDRQYETLRELEAANRNLTEIGLRGGWAKPMDCGGSNGSHHSQTLTNLHRKGLVDRKGYTPGCRVVWTYKINDAGETALGEKAKARLLEDFRHRRTLARLKENSKIDEISGCWNWTGTRNTADYGQLCVDGTARLAHRISYAAHRGPIPNNLFVCHSCDNPPCINPDHLFLGTVIDNAADMVAKGRGQKVKGTDKASAKLTEEDVIAIRAETGISQLKLAVKYGISRPEISNIRRRKKWAHVP